MSERFLAASLTCAAAAAAAACGDDAGGVADADGAGEWQTVWKDTPGALLSIWGTAADDVWAVGGDPDRSGPMVVRWDGSAWQTLEAGSAGDLWWIFGFSGQEVYLGGAGGRILAYAGGDFTPMPTPSTTPVVFGIWGCSPDDVWAVGGNQGGASGAFAWHLEGQEWVEPPGFPAELATTDTVWKVYGLACDDVWFVGTNGLAVHWDGAGFGEPERLGGEPLFTVSAADGCFTAVGGFGTGLIYENCGAGWAEVAPAGVDPMVGVCMVPGGGYAVGWYGAVMTREPGEWTKVEGSPPLDETLHSCWVDPDGGVWAVGGQVAVLPLVDGVMIHLGDKVPEGAW